MNRIRLSDTIDEMGKVEWTFDTKFHLYIVPSYKTHKVLSADNRNRILYYRLDKDQHGLFCLEIFEQNGGLKEISIPYYSGTWSRAKCDSLTKCKRINGVPLFEANLWENRPISNAVAYPNKNDFLDQLHPISIELELQQIKIVLFKEEVDLVVVFNENLEFEFNSNRELSAISLKGITKSEFELMSSNLTKQD